MPEPDEPTPNRVLDFAYFDYDQHRLDEEWHAQPRKMRESCLRYADAVKAHKCEQADFKVTEAELKADVRETPASDYGLTRWTEDALKEKVLLHPRWRKAIQRVIDAEHWELTCKADVETLRDRRPALERTTDLYFAGYFAPPRAGRSATQTAVAEARSRQVLSAQAREPRSR